MIFFKVVPIRRDHVSNVHLMDHQDTTPTPSSTNSLLSTYGTALIIDRVLRMRSSHRWTPKTVQAHKVTAYSELHTSDHCDSETVWTRDNHRLFSFPFFFVMFHGTILRKEKYHMRLHFLKCRQRFVPRSPQTRAAGGGGERSASRSPPESFTSEN